MPLKGVRTATNAQILEALDAFRRESSQERETILSRLADLNTKVAVQNGRIGYAEKTIDGGHPLSHSNRIGQLEKGHWKLGGAIAAMVAAVEFISHILIKR